jgi:para-nitrobenzyl esterase
LYAPGGEAGEAAYRAAFPDADAERLFERVQTDWLFGQPSLRLAQAQRAAGGHAHVYELTWQSPGSGGALGACHGLDIPLLFGTFDADLGALNFPGGKPTQEAEQLSSFIQHSWTAFARTGDPGWPEYDEDTRLVQILDAGEDRKVGPYPEEQSRRIWEGHDFTAALTLP